MNKEQAINILGDWIRGNGSLYCSSPYVRWEVFSAEVCLDADFSLDELKAIVWWIENKST